jgi:hypothetical protein
MMKMSNLGKYNKGIVSILTAIGIGLQTEYPGSHWAVLATGIIGAVLVILVPNTDKNAATVPVPVADADPKVLSFTPSPDTLNLLNQLSDHDLIQRQIKETK